MYVSELFVHVIEVSVAGIALVGEAPLGIPLLLLHFLDHLIQNWMILALLAFLTVYSLLVHLIFVLILEQLVVLLDENIKFRIVTVTIRGPNEHTSQIFLHLERKPRLEFLQALEEPLFSLKIWQFTYSVRHDTMLCVVSRLVSNVPDGNAVFRGYINSQKQIESALLRRIDYDIIKMSLDTGDQLTDAKSFFLAAHAGVMGN